MQLMQLKGYLRLTVLIGCALAVSLAQAGEGLKNEPTAPYSLGEVVVSAGRPAENAVATLEITSDDIEKKHITTLDQALELLPGLDVRKGGEGIPRVNIRGYRSRHTILLLNGIPVNSTYDGQFDPHLISTENIARIKVSYGSHSVLYGQGGLAGVINIITKQGTRGLDTEVSAEMDQRGNHYSKISVSGGKEKVSFFANLNNSDSDGYELSDDFKATKLQDGGLRENSDDQRLGFFGNLVYEVNDAFDIGLTLERSVGEYGTPPITVDDKSNPFYKSPKYDRTEDFETLSGQVSFSYTPRGMFGFRGWAFVNTQDQDTARYDDDTYSTITKKNNYTQSDTTTVKGAALQTSMDLDAYGEAVFSFSGETDEYSADLNKVKTDNKPPVFSHYDHDLDIYSAALEYRIQPFSTLGIVAGYSHHWQDKNEGDDVDKGGYMIAAEFSLTDTTLLRASHARKIRFPSIQQLYDPTAGDPDLEPERSKNYEIGVTQQLFKDMQLDVAVFKNNVEQYIEKLDSSGLYENNDEYEFKGLEIMLARSFLESGRLGLGYSYLETEDKSAGALRDDLQYRPRHKFTVEADYTWSFGLTAHADFMHVAGQYFYSDSFEKGKLDDFSIVNLKMEQQWPKTNFFVYVGVDNLLDENYEESFGLPQPGRTGYAGVKMRF